MQVYPETNTVYCFSTNCELHGKAVDQIDFLMKKEGITKHEALKKAAELCGEVKTEPSLADRFHSMRSSLLKSKKAQQYLSDRNLSSNQEIGYNSYQSGYKQLQNCVTFPLKDKSGNITSIYGRSISDLKGSNHYYLKNQKGLYRGYPQLRYAASLEA